MASLKRLEAEIAQIKSRNRKVEADKAWEKSWTRRALLAIFTYLAIAIYLSAIHIPHALLSAIVPAVGFMLSTLTLPYFKNVWIRRVYA
jgi:hypothetical protein